MTTYWRRLVVLVVLTMVAAGCGGGSEPSGADASPATTAAPASGAVDDLTGVRSAVVRIEAEGTFSYPEGTAYNEGSVGSGFFISPDGIAVTNNHVVTGAAFLKVYVEGEDEPRNAKLLGVSECSDLAVIDVEGEDFEYLAWVDDPIQVGLEVFAAGYPLGTAEYTLLDGIVSKEDALGETSWASVDSVIEHTADTLPGNSGGPLVTTDGRLVGVNYAGDDSGQAYAIGREEATNVLSSLASGSDVTSIGINGTAMLVDGASGVYVHSVASGSPADLVGVAGGDVITEIEGIIPGDDGTMADYCDVLRSNDADAPLQIEVWRDSVGAYFDGTMNTERIFSEAPGTPGPGDDEEASGGTDGVDAFGVGSCINDDQVEGMLAGADFSTTECQAVHDNEVYAIVELADGAYPGDEALQATGEQVCLDQFPSYVGRDYESSALGLAPLPPDADIWADGGRHVICFLYDYEGGTLAGSAYQTGW